MGSFPRPRSLSCNACFRIAMMFSSVSGFNDNTVDLEIRALLTSKKGFSVVAPIRMTVPSSTCGRSASCCILLKRWISSTKSTTLPFGVRIGFFASSTIRLISETPAVTALIRSNLADVVWAMRRASAVLPVPGGPKRMMEDRRSASIILLSIFPSPRICSWPIYSDKERGAMRNAKGSLFLYSSLTPILIVPHCLSMRYPAVFRKEY